jgi:Tfp pilus assembly protein PilF
MRDCLSFDMKNKEVMMSYAVLLCQMKRFQEAIVLLRHLIAGATPYEPSKVNRLISIAYDMAGDSNMTQKYNAIADLAKLRELDRVPAAGRSQEEYAPKASQYMNRVMTPQSSAMS